MFTVGLIHTRDHDPGCSGADSESATRQTGGGSYIMPIQECSREVGSHHSPRSLGGPQVKSKVLLAQHN